MPVGEICIRNVIICNRSTTIHEAAQLMLQYNVGDVLVVDESGNKRIPVGVVTDRDIAMDVVASKLDPVLTLTGDLVKKAVITVREDSGVFETIQQMRMHGVRRMPVVDRDGGLVGILSIDDVVQLLAEEMSELAKLISKEQPRPDQPKRSGGRA
jgi:CBS domain-containing protein